MTRALLSAALIVSAAGCAAPAPPTPAVDTPSSSGVPATARPGGDAFPPGYTPLDTTATASAPARRVNPPSSVEVAPFDPVAYVNGLPYLHFDLEPAMTAYRVVATTRGWTPETIERWSPFVYDVMAKESGGCWNLLGGAVMEFPQTGCNIARQGHGEDAGVGQVTSAGWGPSGAACKLAGLCSREAVIASPWSSMTAMLVLMEAHGSFPWCFSDWARSFHDCTLIDRDERPVAA